MAHFLTGKKGICNFVGRSWATVESWIINLAFPAKLINGRWESDSDLIGKWRRAQFDRKKEEEKKEKTKKKLAKQRGNPKLSNNIHN